MADGSLATIVIGAVNGDPQHSGSGRTNTKNKSSEDGGTLATSDSKLYKKVKQRVYFYRG